MDPTAEAGGGESLLVVDDDPFIARLLEIELRAAGYDVRVASDGSLALSAAQERCPDLVLADVMMPNMDGFELTRRLRQDPRTASVSIGIASTDKRAFQHYAEAGAVATEMKQFTKGSTGSSWAMDRRVG